MRKRLAISQIVTAVGTFILLVISVRSQGQYFRQLNSYQFLNASNVYHVVRDSRGFLWFCTNHGLAKYDGHATQYYTQEKGLADNMVFNIYEDSKGRIWPFCYNGRYCFLDGDSIHTEANDSSLARIPHTQSYITCIAEGRGGQMFFGFLSKDLFVINGGRAAWVPRQNKTDVLAVSADKIEYSSLPQAGVSVILRAKDYQLRADAIGLKVYYKGVLTWINNDPSLTDKTVTDLVLTRDNSLVIATIHGLVIVNLTTGKRLHILSGMRVSGCTEDINGNIWVTTINNGVYFLHQELDKIHPLLAIDGQELVSIHNNRLTFIKASTLYEVVPDNGGLQINILRRSVPNYYNPLVFTEQLAGFYDTWKKQILIEYKAHYKNFEKALFFKRIYIAGNYYVAIGKNAVYYYQLINGRLVEQGTARTYPQKINVSCQDGTTNEVYFINGSSIYRCNFQKAESEIIYSSPLLKEATSMIIRENTILVATGAPKYFSLHLNNRQPRVTEINTAFLVKDIVPLSPGKMLLSSDGADYLSNWRTSRHSAQRVQYPFPASSYEVMKILGNNCIVQLDGKYYYFDTSLLNKRISMASVYLKRLVVNGKDYTNQRVEINNTVKLDIAASLGILDFGNSVEGVKYRLAGTEHSDWHSTGATDIAFVLRKPGRYSIEILPDNADQNVKPLVVAIYVHTPFSKSTPFYVLCACVLLIVIIALGLLIARYRKRHFTRELNYLKMEHKAINALLNPHFIFNSINNIQGLIHKLKTTEATDYLATLSRLVRQNLENLQYNLIPLENELELIERYVQLQNLRFSGDIRIVIEAEDQTLFAHVPPLLIHTFVENSIVHGYRKKNSGFLIKVNIALYEDDYLKITISDNGVGFTAAKKRPARNEKTSMGISFSRKRLNRVSDFYNLEQSISVKDLSTEGGQGSEVTIIIYSKLRELFEHKHLPVH